MGIKICWPRLRQLLVCNALLSLCLSLALVGFARADTSKIQSTMTNTEQSLLTTIEQGTGQTIVASIRPLALLLNDLVLPADKVIQLVKNNNSAHHYQLKVSDRRLLQTADLVVWVGPELELFLEKPLRQVKRAVAQSIIALSDTPGIQWPESEDKQASHDNDKHGHDKHEHHGRDPHIWLNPINVQAMVKLLTKRLIKLSPDNATAYQQKADALINALTQLDSEMAEQLADVADKPFTVLHPAYSHFINRYKLNQLDYVVINPESAIGAKHLYELSQYEMVCVFGEVGQANQHIEKIAESSKAKVGQLDPLGSDLDDDASITQLIRKLADDFQTCLA